jgi:hypothetical protein
MKRLQLTVSDATNDLIERAVLDLKRELSQEPGQEVGLVLRKGFVIGEILRRYYEIIDNKEMEEK